LATDEAGPEPEYQAPFAELLDIHSGQSANGIGSVSMVIQDQHCQEAGVVQGGIIVTLGDHALYRAIQSVLRPDENSVTIELKVNFIAPARDGQLTATARVISRGSRIIVGDMEITDDRQRLIARGLGTYLVTRRRNG
jgi:uncharacterized protein (TIGR00369 family)